MTSNGKPAGLGLRACPGDRLVIRGHAVGEHERDAEIVETLGENGAPPFRVRWEDTGRETEIFPGADAYVDHLTDHAHGPAAEAGHRSVDSG